VLAALAGGDGTVAAVPREHRISLAAKAFKLSSQYDQRISELFAALGKHGDGPSVG
jgi:AICAR transformylase/IMP cyclohydrolase PurH